MRGGGRRNRLGALMFTRSDMHMLKHDAQALLRVLLGQCPTYVRTDLRTTTHLGKSSHVGYRAQGGSKNFPLAEVNPAPAAAMRGLQAVSHA